MPRNSEAFGVRLSFLALFGICRGPGSKAAEGTAALHDAGARFQHAAKWRSATTMARGLDLSHGCALSTSRSKASDRPLFCRRYIAA